MSQHEKLPVPQHVADCAHLTPNQLRLRYPTEATSHRNMLSRAEKYGRIIDPEFRKFRDFLRHVGVRPQGTTLDRINNEDPIYGPGRVRWADRTTQNNNKGDTLKFSYSRTGETYTVERLAQMRNVSPAAIRKRKQRGWTDDQVIEGRRASALRPRTEPTPFDAQKPRFTSLKRNSLSIAEVTWRRNQEYAAYHRAEYGCEYCLADLQTLNDFVGECGFIVTPAAYRRKFRKWWDEWRPHLILNNLPEWAQELIVDLEKQRLANCN